jgi:hypothetical protein
MFAALSVNLPDVLMRLIVVGEQAILSLRL